MDVKIGGLYRHFKGGLYKVIGIAEHSETLEKHVVYKSLKTGRLWVRPVSMWDDIVDGKKRFEFIGLEEGEDKQWQV